MSGAAASERPPEEGKNGAFMASVACLEARLYFLLVVLVSILMIPCLFGLLSLFFLSLSVCAFLRANMWLISVPEDVSDYWMICSLFSRHFADLLSFVANDIVMETIMAPSATAVAGLSSIVAVFNSTFRTQKGSR